LQGRRNGCRKGSSTGGQKRAGRESKDRVSVRGRVTRSKVLNTTSETAGDIISWRIWDLEGNAIGAHRRRPSSWSIYSTAAREHRSTPEAVQSQRHQPKVTSHRWCQPPTVDTAGQYHLGCQHSSPNCPIYSSAVVPLFLRISLITAHVLWPEWANLIINEI